MLEDGYKIEVKQPIKLQDMSVQPSYTLDLSMQIPMERSVMSQVTAVSKGMLEL